MKERYKLLLLVLTFVGIYYIPWDSEAIRRSGLEAFMMLEDYAHHHVLTCLVPAFFIAGVMGLKKTATFCAIIVVLSTIAGISYGWLAG